MCKHLLRVLLRRFAARPWGVVALAALSACGSDAAAGRRPAAVAPPAVAESQALELLQSTDEAATPVVAWLRAVKAKDAPLLQGALSSRVKMMLGRVDWQDLLAHYAGNLDRALGAWELADFKFTGIIQAKDAPNAAKVQCRFAPQGRPARDMTIGVVREGKEWRIDVYPGGYKPPVAR
jgi:hypothetical protein